MDSQIELRKLPIGVTSELVQLLEAEDAWKLLMAAIPKDPYDLQSANKYNSHHINLISQASVQQKRHPSAIFLEEWGTSGKVRPSLKYLLELALNARLYRIADYIAVDLLKGNPPERPSSGPDALADFDNPSSFCEDLLIQQSGKLQHFPFMFLDQITDNFSENDVSAANITECDPIKILEEGRKLGSGAFGSVYLGFIRPHFVAVKRLKNDGFNADKQFESEVESLSSFQHPNLVKLLGYSCDGPSFCLVYEYMENGSLQQRLDKESTNVPDCRSRVNIAFGTAKGIQYLHSREKVLIHRDIKSANILLDRNWKPKIGDFGLARIIVPVEANESMYTSTVIGTSAYMAPEAFRGEISVKLDVYSFGVVLLELLTGLPPYEEEKEDCDLVTDIKSQCATCIAPSFLDARVTSWNINDNDAANKLFCVAMNCLQDDKDERLEITSACLQIQELLGE